MKGQFIPYQDENPTKNKPYLNYTLIVVCVIIFIISLIDFENIIYTFGFTPTLLVPITFLTSMFLHGSILHLGFNMWYLYLFGDNVEDMFGKTKYLLFYLTAGLAATLLHLVTNMGSDIPAIGASGAISGVLGAYVVIFPHVKVRAIFYGIWRLPAYVIIGFWFVFQLIFLTIDIFGGGDSTIAFWAHIGGFIFGLVVGKMFVSIKKPPKIPPLQKPPKPGQ